MNRRLFIVAALVTLAVPTWATVQLLPAFLTDANCTLPKSVSRSKVFVAHVSFTVKPGFHVYSNVPGDENAIPTTIDLEDGSKYKITAIRWPEAHKDAMGVMILEGKVNVSVSIMPPALKANKSVLKLRLRSQGCNASSCLPPATVALLSVHDIK